MPALLEKPGRQIKKRYVNACPSTMHAGSVVVIVKGFNLPQPRIDCFYRGHKIDHLLA